MILIQHVVLVAALGVAIFVSSVTSLSADPGQANRNKGSILSEETEKNRHKGPRQHARWGHRYAHQR